MPSLVGSDRIERLEILNFKSLKRHQIVGPFKDFAAIIDAKGAGRTDLVAAITFLLGVRSFQLRGAQHWDDREHSEARGKIAFVKLAVCTARGEEIKFGRAITRSGTSEYRVNNIPVTWEMYNQSIHGLDILGDIDCDSCKDTEEPAPVSQPLRGSEQCTIIEAEVEIQKKRADEKMISIEQKRKMFAATREQKREQKEDSPDEHLWVNGTEMDSNAAEMELLPAGIERTASEVAALDQHQSLREKERKHNEELEAARKSAIEAADKWKTGTLQPSFGSLAPPLPRLDESDAIPDALHATKATVPHVRSNSRLKSGDSIGNDQGEGFQSSDQRGMDNNKGGELNLDGGEAGVAREIERDEKRTRSLGRNRSGRSGRMSRSISGARSDQGVEESSKAIHESHKPAETSSQPDTTDSDAHTSQWLENLDDRMYWSDIDPDDDSLGKAEELAGSLFQDAMELHERLSAEADAQAADGSRFCSEGQHLMAETKETCGAIMYANGHGEKIRLGEDSELMLVADSESRPLSFSQTSQSSDASASGLGATERAHLERMRANQRAMGLAHLTPDEKKVPRNGDDDAMVKTNFGDEFAGGDEKDGASVSALGKEMSRLRASNVRKQVKIDSLQKWKAYYKVELEARVQSLEQMEKRHAKELKKREKAIRKVKKAHREEVAHREAKREGMETKLREQIKELNLVIEELSGQLYDMEEHLATTGIPYKPSVNEHTGPSSKTLLSAVISVKEAAHTFSRTFMSYLKQHLTKARDLDEQICLESEVIVARPSDYKFLVQSFICRRMFSDFDSECFNIESCMTEIFDIDDHARACFQEYMTYRNVAETVTLLTDNRQHSGFLREFCFKKFLHIVSESTEEAFFGDFNHSDDICAGRHPSSRFYESYCKLAVSVWLLHRLSFSFQPPARMISVRKGAHFDPAYMESAVPGIADADLGAANGSGLPFEALVGLMVHPGFRVGSSIIPAQVYLVTT